jgi:hypothetical protein
VQTFAREKFALQHRYAMALHTGWWGVSEILIAEGQPELAAQVRAVAAKMPPPRTDREAIAEQLLERVRHARLREGPTR